MGILRGLSDRINGYLYKCEYSKKCDKTTIQCSCGGNSYCGEYRRKVAAVNAS